MSESMPPSSTGERARLFWREVGAAGKPGQKKCREVELVPLRPERGSVCVYSSDAHGPSTCSVPCGACLAPTLAVKTRSKTHCASHPFLWLSWASRVVSRMLWGSAQEAFIRRESPHPSHGDSTCACSLGVCNWGLELSARGAKGKVMVQQGPWVLRPGLASPLGLSGLLAYRSSFGFKPLSRTPKPCPVLSLCGNVRPGDGQPLGAGSL